MLVKISFIGVKPLRNHKYHSCCNLQSTSVIVLGKHYIKPEYGRLTYKFFLVALSVSDNSNKEQNIDENDDTIWTSSML